MKFLLYPLKEVLLPLFFPEIVKTDFHNQVTRIDNERVSSTSTPLFMDLHILLVKDAAIYLFSTYTTYKEQHYNPIRYFP